MALSNGLDGTNLPLQFLLPGFGRGEARGERKNMLATATRMLKDGVLALKDVARYSGLSLAQVKKLQASMA